MHMELKKELDETKKKLTEEQHLNRKLAHELQTLKGGC